MIRTSPYCPQCGTPTVDQAIHGRERPVCPSCEHIVYFDPKVAVIAFIVQNDQVLLVERAFDPGKGLWACPAGFVEHDESPEDAIIREVWEETGLIVTVDRLLAVFPKRDHGMADIVIAYAMTIIGGELQAGDDAAAVGWFTRDTLPELVFVPSQTLVGERWRKGEL